MNALTTQATMDENWIMTAWVRKQRSDHTRRAYEADLKQFMDFAGVPLAQVDLATVQAFHTHLDDLGLSSASIARRLSSIKSLIRFAWEWHLFPVDFGAYVQLPAIKDTLAARIMTQAETLRLLNTDASPRDSAMLWTLYNGGLRISELTGLTWRDLVDGKIVVLGKGGKTRVIRLAPAVWARLEVLKTDTSKPDDHVFPVTVQTVHRAVKTAAKNAGLSVDVSAHWLRHAHASHALKNGADANLVRTTLGHASLETTTRYCHAEADTSSSSYLAA